MSVRSRVEDAEHLWAQGRAEGAWVQALIAAAATARKRYPRPMGDREAFEAFICDIASTIVSGKTGGPSPIYIRFYSDKPEEHRTLEGIFYSELRCNLVHEAELGEIGLSKSIQHGNQLQASLNVPTRGAAQIPDFWVLNLLAAVRDAPENQHLWPNPAC